MTRAGTLLWICIGAACLFLALCWHAESAERFSTIGTASWYGQRFHGRPTASGERFNQGAATCAHRTLPFGTTLEVQNLRNGRRKRCRVNDRGPYVAGRILDVSRAVAIALGFERAGLARVKLKVVR